MVVCVYGCGCVNSDVNVWGWIVLMFVCAFWVVGSIKR